MSRTPNPIGTEYLTLGIREDLKRKLDLHLFDPSQGRVPHGAYKAFFEPFLESFFGDTHADA